MNIESSKDFVNHNKIFYPKYDKFKDKNDEDIN